MTLGYIYEDTVSPPLYYRYTSTTDMQVSKKTHVSRKRYRSFFPDHEYIGQLHVLPRILARNTGVADNCILFAFLFFVF